jgi:hypothetical protein
LRANRTHPPDVNHRGYTYNHQPMLAWWNNRFYLEYLGAHHNECDDGTEAFLTSSEDGIRWGAPVVLFPSIEYESWKRTIAHHRMGFFVAPSGRLLAMSFYGIPRGQYRLPNDGFGLGRAVREIYRDGSLGPIYFLRYMPHRGFTEETNARWYPSYRKSLDKGFVEACEALLANKLVTLQWWEEDRSEDGFYSLKGSSEYTTLKALSYYHRKDGAVVGLWKFRWAALTFDEGRSWTPPVKLASFLYEGAKVWGQKTADGRFAVFYNPHGSRRYPLVVNTSEDGITYENLWGVHGEVPEQRYTGWHREHGPQYPRGIVEGNGNPPGGHVWLSYSMNKEDIWISRIQLPIQARASGWVEDTFDTPGPPAKDWNLYSPSWAPAGVVLEQGNSCLKLEDSDPYDYAKAVRVFPETRGVEVRFRLKAVPVDEGRLEVELLDGRGRRPVRIHWAGPERSVRANSGDTMAEVGSFKRGQWLEVSVRADLDRRQYDLSIDGKTLLRDAPFAEAGSISSLQRLEFRTGPYRLGTSWKYSAEPQMNDGLPGADEKQPTSVFLIDDVKIQGR